MDSLLNQAMPLAPRANQAMSQASNYQDISSLDNLRKEAQGDEKAALEKVAKQFEGIFMKMLLKSMREANKAFESESPFNSQSSETYRNMHDDQMAMELSENGSLGLAGLIVQQLSPQSSGFTPSSVLRSDSGMPMTQAAASRNNTASEVPASIDKNLAQVAQQPKFTSPKDFVEQLLPLANKAAKELGASPNLLIAQAALETGWGQKIAAKQPQQSSFNLFNIKADKRWDGESAKVSTLEYRDGVAVREKAQFRAYDDFKQSFEDFAGFIKNSSRYQQAMENVSNPASFLQGIQKAGYATDPNYADKVMSVLGRVNQFVK